jgi:hypothetical protein
MTYFGIEDGNGNNLKTLVTKTDDGTIVDKLANAKSSDVMVCASSSATTLEANVLTSLGNSKPSIDITTNNTLKLTFTNTSGLEHIKEVEYELVYNSDDGKYVDERSGVYTIARPTGEGTTSVMDDNRTENTVTLTIKNTDSNLFRWTEFTGKGMYSLILYFKDDSGKTIIKYDDNDLEFF